MKNRIITAFLVLVLIAGVGILAYPLVSNVLHDRKQDKILTDYKEEVQNLDQDEQEALLKAAREYNEGLIGTVVLTDPFDPDAIKKMDGEYLELLNTGENGIMAYVEIPKIKVYEPIYHGTTEEVLARGIGHMDKTSLPVGGMGTHAVISGHTGLPEAEIFTNLNTLEEGDIFYIHVLKEHLAYQVDQVKVVEPSDTSDLLIDAEEDYVTLITCTPYGINSHRLLVRGTRVPYTPKVEAAAAEQASQGAGWKNWKKIYGKALLEGGLAGSGILLVLIVVRKTSRRIRREKKI